MTKTDALTRFRPHPLTHSHLLEAHSIEPCNPRHAGDPLLLRTQRVITTRHGTT